MMTKAITFEALVSAVPGLSRRRLQRYVEAGIIIPVQRPDREADIEAMVFRPVDEARLMLACELADQFELQDEALGLMLDLVDRMHGLRAELHALMEAVAAQPTETRRAIGTLLQEARHRR